MPVLFDEGVMSVRCPLGGTAPCCDDLCHGSDRTLCGLERGFDLCDHDEDPDSCKQCQSEDDYEWQPSYTGDDRIVATEDGA